jgi:C4-dicarboxylate-specific signal transduction histidine kinase
VVLSSYPEQLENGTTRQNIYDFAWYQQISHSRLVGKALNSILVSIEGVDFLISKLNVEELGWRLILLMPLKAPLNDTFFNNMIMIFAFGLVLFLHIYWIVNKYRQKIVATISVDGLSKVYNRQAIQQNKVKLNWGS